MDNDGKDGREKNVRPDIRDVIKPFLDKFIKHVKPQALSVHLKNLSDGDQATIENLDHVYVGPNDRVNTFIRLMGGKVSAKELKEALLKENFIELAQALEDSYRKQTGHSTDDDVSPKPSVQESVPSEQESVPSEQEPSEQEPSEQANRNP